MARAELAGLIDERNLYLFVIWWGLSSDMSRGFQLDSLKQQPIAVIRDFSYLLGRLSKLRKARKQRAERRKELEKTTRRRK